MKDFLSRCVSVAAGALLFAVRLVVYVPHAAAHVLCVHVLPVSIVAAVVLSGPFVAIAAWAELSRLAGQHWLALLGLEGVQDDASLVALVGVLGIIPMAVSKLWGRIAEAATALWERLWEMLAGPWVPRGLEVKESLADTGGVLRERARVATAAVGSAVVLFGFLSALALVVMLARAALPNDDIKRRLAELDHSVSAHASVQERGLRGLDVRLSAISSRITSALETIRRTAPPDADPAFVAFVTQQLVTIRNSVEGDPPDEPGKRNGSEPAPRRVVFSVPYRHDGQLRTKVGICLDEWQLEWLGEFKEAIVECSSEAAEALELLVVGYSSVSPATSADGTVRRHVKLRRHQS